MFQQSSWPGERQPHEKDIELGIESLDQDFLSQFKASLKANAAGYENEQLMQVRLDTLSPSTREFTYPLSLLYEFPLLPPDDVVEALYKSFCETFRAHPLLNSLALPAPAHGMTVPFFKYALASLVSAATSGAGSPRGVQDRDSRPDIRQTSRSLYLAGARLWNVMLEVDNREARTLEGVVSPVILSLYATMTADVEIWSLVEQQLLPSACTMARRLRLHDPFKEQDISTPQSLGARNRSSVIAMLFLTCTIAAIHLDISLYFTTAELSTMTGSDGESIHFQELYTQLLCEVGNVYLIERSNVDPVMLLVAILADTISLQRSLMPHGTFDVLYLTEKLATEEPAPALSPASEYQRMSERLREALERWYERFAARDEQAHLLLFYLCSLLLECPQISRLPGLVGYPPNRPGNDEAFERSMEAILISDRAVDLAWAIVDHTGPGKADENSICPVWEPLAVFLAALVVWAKAQQQAAHGLGGRRKQLLIYKLELDRMPWPCCRDMAITLERLLQQS